MSAFDTEDIEKFRQLAFELRETFEERGHNVGSALEMDPAFTDSGRTRSSLERDLAIRAFLVASSRVGLNLHPAPGGPVQVGVNLPDGRTAVVRLKKAKLVGGRYRISSNNESTWADFDEDKFVPEVPYAFGHTITNGQIDDVFLSEVLGATAGKPGHLIFGGTLVFPRTGLGPDGPGGGFNPRIDDDLPGFESDGAEDLDVG